MHLRHESDDAAIEIRLAQVVIGKRLSDHGCTISRIFFHPVRQTILRILPVIDYGATPVGARIVTFVSVARGLTSYAAEMLSCVHAVVVHFFRTPPDQTSL